MNEDKKYNGWTNFETWKINALEEVARLKIKRKIENIDKAGLTEILNG